VFIPFKAPFSSGVARGEGGKWRHAPWGKGVGRNFFRGEGNGKRPKISKNYQKIALFSLFQGGGQRKKTEK